MAELCDESLTLRHIYHFRKISIALDRVLMISESDCAKEFRLKSEMIDAHVILPDVCDK